MIDKIICSIFKIFALNFAFFLSGEVRHERLQRDDRRVTERLRDVERRRVRNVRPSPEETQPGKKRTGQQGRQETEVDHRARQRFVTSFRSL